tara:strand:- start:114303 stop:116546 length:2244 start_codon:yes stop_codon:yes gene_type:complete
MRRYRFVPLAFAFVLCGFTGIASAEGHPSDVVKSDTSNSDTSNSESIVSRVRPSVVTIRVQGRDGDELGIGTGFVVDAQGLIATNFHVIQEGRPFSVETSDNRKLNVLAVESSDRIGDLVVLRVDVGKERLPTLELADDATPKQGSRVLAFGNPLGLEDSVVEGIVSAVRNIEGREMIQLAMPIEPGNSGGPLVDQQGRVVGIINMKSAIDDNLGFAIPVRDLSALRKHPNPISIDRWVRLGRLDESRWQPIGGALWQQIGGRITARGIGKGFGGRSLCLSMQDVPDPPYDVSVMVRLDDESGAAGLAFHSDGEDKHYGFYPSGEKIRLTCFQGPSVYTWDVLHDVESDDYVPKQWNHLRVRVDDSKMTCYVNGQETFQSTDRRLIGGRVGLVKFRGTQPEFRAFRLDSNVQPKSLSKSTLNWLARLDAGDVQIDRVGESQVRKLGDTAMLSGRELERRARAMLQEAERLKLLAADVRQSPTLQSLERLSDIPAEDRLLRGAMLIAKLDDPDLDIQSYIDRVDQMAAEIREPLDPDATPRQRRTALDRYLFKENGFHGGRAEYYHPANSHLNRVIDDREGLPITMSILYIELGRRLDLQMAGVGLPGHFVVSHRIDPDTDQLIDVFDSGTILSRRQAGAMVMQFAGRRMSASDLKPQTTTEILTRVLNNLMGIATEKRESESMLRYIEAIVALNPDVADYRMMRAQLRGMTGRKDRAIADLDWLLDSETSQFSAHHLQQMRAMMLPK